MIYWTKEGENDDCWFVQTNNPTEEMLRKRSIFNMDQVKTVLSSAGQSSLDPAMNKFLHLFLETCGCSACATCVASLGFGTDIFVPDKSDDSYKPQADQIVADFLNDPNNYATMRTVRPDVDPSAVFGNEIAQYYPVAARKIFGARADFVFVTGWEQVADFIKKGCALQMALKNPGHFLAFVGYDDQANVLKYRDPWPERLNNGKTVQDMGQSEYTTNVQNFAIVYYPIERIAS